MASKSVSPVDIVLGIKGGEKLAALNRSFRDLSKQTKLSDRDINQATKDIVKFAKEAGNSEATIKGQIKAFEGLREQAATGGKVYRELGVSIGNLKSALRGSSDAVERKRSSLVKLGSASKNSAKDLRYVIAQLEKLKSKVREDSVAFLQLGKDIKNLNVSLKEVEISSGKARFAINTIISAKPEIITGQIEKLNASIASGTLDAENLNIALRKLELLRVGAERGPIGFRTNVFSSELGVDYFARLKKEYGSLEKTQATISQRISEVNQELTNVTGYERRRALTVELIQLNKDLQNAIVNVTTKEQFQAMAIRQRMGGARESYSQSGFGAFSSSIRQRSAAGEFTPGMQRAKERARNQIVDERAVTEATELFRVWSEAYGKIEGAARNHKSEMLRIQTEKNKLLIEQQDDASDKLIRKNAEAFDRELALFDQKLASKDRVTQRTGAIKSMLGLSGVDLSPLYEDIVGIGSSRQKGQQARMGKSYEEVSADIRAATAASNGSISSLEKQRSVWTQLRNGLDPASDAFKEVTRDIERVDRALEKTSRTRRKFSPGKAAQVAGATISGGIFGGPEGFLGGAIGGAVGGVGGSFAGAALGAQVGQLRQTLGGFADYAAGITKLKIALKGITDDAYSYGQALQAAADVTKELNVPQEVAIKGITRLTAAVQGAGGGVADAELAFKNITAAITATGGGAEQVEGAVTALVQIFSKGKVSAEEINQIAERLPGTFNKIAKASGRTGPELTKALQSGEVGLNDLMKFLVQLGGEYGELAKKIAGSSESAGARLTVAYNNMRIEIGKALQPVGAEFQQAFADFIENITPALLSTLPKLGQLFLSVAENLDVLAAAAVAAGLALGGLAAKVAIIKAGSIAALFAKIATAASSAGIALKGMSAAALLNPWVLLAAGAAAATVGVVKYYQAQKELNQLLDEGKGSTETIKEKMQEYRDEITKTRNKLKGINGEQKATGRQANSLKKKVAELRSELERLDGTYKIRIKYENKGYKYDEKGRMKEFTSGEIVYGGPIGARAKALRRVDGKPLNDSTVFPSPKDGEGEDKSGKGSARKSRLPQLQDKYDSIFRSRQLVEIQRFQIANSLALVRAQKDNNKELAYTIRNNQINLNFAAQELQVTNQYLDAMNAANRIEDVGERQLAERIAELKRSIDLEKLIVSANGEKLALTQDTAIAAERIAKASEDELFNLRDQLGLVTNEDKINRFRQSRKDAGDPNADQQTDLFRQTIDPTLQEGLGQNIRQMKKDLEELEDPVNQIVGAANAIGDSFAQSFKSVIDGSATAQEALASFFQNLSNYFLDMATQIIAEMVKIAILNAVTGLLPGGGGGGGGGIPFLSDAPSITGNKIGDFGGGTPLFAKGGVFAKNKIVPYAKGGIFNKPTMFAYANGGAGNFGLLGEAGPEAIMPLSRGSDGKLGVKAAGGGTVINITNNIAEGKSTSRGNGSDSQGISQLSKMMVAVIQREQRPGGVLNR